jgi:hypothetical protein
MITARLPEVYFHIIMYLQHAYTRTCQTRNCHSLGKARHCWRAVATCHLEAQYHSEPSPQPVEFAIDIFKDSGALVQRKRQCLL